MIREGERERERENERALWVKWCAVFTQVE